MEHYKETLNHIYTAYNTSAEGISREEASRRLQKYGRNELAEEKKDPWWKLLLGQFNSPVIWVLLGAVLVSVIVGEGADALIIGIILVINAIIGFYQENKAEQAIEALKKMAGLRATVIRSGKQIKIDATELVPGDVIILETGEKIPADSRLIEASNLETQEAALTGESNPVTKEAGEISNNKTIGDRSNMVHSSTIITRGHGKALVVSTGMQTEIGKIAHMIQTTKTEQTPLQKQLAGLGKWLGILTLLICATVFAAGLLMHEGAPLELFITAVALAVAAIPEGLPAVVTISLSLGVKRMVKRNALMRHLPSVETLGCTTVICSDKTGTLTHNQMTVRKLYVGGKDVEVTGSGYNPKGKISADSPDIKLLLRIGAQNNDAKIDRDKWTCMGDPTEGCLITSAMKAGLDKTALDKESPRLDEIPFDSERKMMTTIHKIGGKKTAYVKGAADLLLAKCTKILIAGKIKKLTPAEKKKILSKNEEYAKSALRVLGFAYKEPSGKASKKSYETDLVFVGLQAMIDPPRKEVKSAIATCKEAGIKVVMITGDLQTTAETIAAELGITGKSMTGTELQKMSEQELQRAVDDISIYARVNPKHKLKIVTALQSKGHIVAMTGDGVNDAPALKKADIGVSMGKTGTDVAKEASEMILTDDNFTSIVNAVEEGRGIYDNIRKFVNYLLSCNVGEVLLIFVATLLGIPLPLIAVHLLWVNLVTDGFPAVALGVDPVSQGAMKRPPRKVRSKIMSLGMSMNVFSIGILIAGASLAVYYVGMIEGLKTARTMAFTVLVMLEMVRLGMIRSAYKTPILSNKWLILAVISSVALQILVIYTPLSHLFRTVPLGTWEWSIIGIGLAGVLLIGLITTKIVNKMSNEMY